MSRDALLPLALGLAGLLVILAFADDLERIARPLMRRLRARVEPYMSKRLLIPIILSVLLAVLYPGMLLKLYFVVAGGLVGWYLHHRSRRSAQEIHPRQISQFVLAFRGAFQLQPSVFSSLADVSRKLSEPLLGLVNTLVQTYYLTSSEQRAFDEFRARTDNIYLHQFVYILEASETARPETVIRALDEFVDRLKQHEEMRHTVDTSLAPITEQTGFLQVLSIIIIFIVGLVPPLRDTYASMPMQAMFIIAASVGIGTSYYIDREASSLKGRIR